MHHFLTELLLCYIFKINYLNLVPAPTFCVPAPFFTKNTDFRLYLTCPHAECLTHMMMCLRALMQSWKRLFKCSWQIGWKTKCVPIYVGCT